MYQEKHKIDDAYKILINFRIFEAGNSGQRERRKSPHSGSVAKAASTQYKEQVKKSVYRDFWIKTFITGRTLCRMSRSNAIIEEEEEEVHESGAAFMKSLADRVNRLGK